MKWHFPRYFENLSSYLHEGPDHDILPVVVLMFIRADHPVLASALADTPPDQPDEVVEEGEGRRYRTRPVLYQDLVPLELPDYQLQREGLNQTLMSVGGPFIGWFDRNQLSLTCKITAFEFVFVVSRSSFIYFQQISLA